MRAQKKKRQKKKYCTPAHMHYKVSAACQLSMHRCTHVIMCGKNMCVCVPTCRLWSILSFRFSCQQTRCQVKSLAIFSLRSRGERLLSKKPRLHLRFGSTKQLLMVFARWTDFISFESFNQRRHASGGEAAERCWSGVNRQERMTAAEEWKQHGAAIKRCC